MESSAVVAEKRHATSIGVAATLIIDGTRVPARIYAARGMKYQMDGGTLQQRRLSAVVLCSLLPQSRLIDADGNTRTLEITHVETGLVYRIDPGGVNISPYRVFYSLKASQPTAVK